MYNNQRLILKSYPDTQVSSSNFSYENVPIPTGDLLPKQIQVRLLHLSVDPYMRVKMHEKVPRGYFEPFKLGQPLNGHVIARVIKAGSQVDQSKFKVGQVFQGDLPWQLEQVVDTDKNDSLMPLKDVEGIPFSHFIGTLGMPGLTSYIGLIELGKPKAGETLVVTAASGAVGTTVIQLGKILGLKVVGISGSDREKELKELGCDHVINYKNYPSVEDMKQAIERVCPNGVDVYFENVGGYVQVSCSIQI